MDEIKLTWKDDAEFDQLVAKIAENSPYKRIEITNKKWMRVSEMGKLLGLKKTDRYWLVHKNYFKTEVIMGKMRVEVESFEKWYANQVKYRKVTGEEPGLELKKRSYSPRDIAGMLGISEGHVYELMIRDNIETVIVDYWKRVPAEAFWEWYGNQSRYRTQEDRLKDKELEEATISMPEMARMLGVPRSTIYRIVDSERYGEFFESVTIGARRRYKKEGFEQFLKSQNRYKVKPVETDSLEPVEVPVEETKPKNVKTMKVQDKADLEDKVVFTLSEAAVYAGVSKKTVSLWCRNNYFPNAKQGKVLRIPSNEYKHWLKNNKGES